MADHQPVKQHAQAREMLLYRRFGQPRSFHLRRYEHFDVGGDMRRFHFPKSQPPFSRTLGEPACRLVIGPPRVVVRNMRRGLRRQVFPLKREEAEEGLGGFFIGQEQRRKLHAQSRDHAGSFAEVTISLMCFLPRLPFHGYPRCAAGDWRNR